MKLAVYSIGCGLKKRAELRKCQLRDRYLADVWSPVDYNSTPPCLKHADFAPSPSAPIISLSQNRRWARGRLGCARQTRDCLARMWRMSRLP